MWIKRSKMKLKNKCGKISKKFRNIKKKKKKNIENDFSFNIAYLKKSVISLSFSLFLIALLLARIVKIITRNFCSTLLFFFKRKARK